MAAPRSYVPGLDQTLIYLTKPAGPKSECYCKYRPTTERKARRCVSDFDDLGHGHSRDDRLSSLNVWDLTST